MRYRDFYALVSAWKQQKGARREACLHVNHWLGEHELTWNFHRLKEFIFSQQRLLRYNLEQYDEHDLSNETARRVKAEQGQAAYQWLLELLDEE